VNKITKLVNEGLIADQEIAERWIRAANEALLRYALLDGESTPTQRARAIVELAQEMERELTGELGRLGLPFLWYHAARSGLARVQWEKIAEAFIGGIDG
jgi:hypothetical protein